MSDIERRLLARLTTPEDIGLAYDTGTRSVQFEEPLASAIFSFSLNYWQNSQMKSAPTAWVLTQEFPGYVPLTGVEEETEYLAESLKTQYLANQVQDLLRGGAKISVSNPAEALKMLRDGSHTLSEAVSTRRLRTNMADTIEARRERYGQREDAPQGLGVPYGLDQLDIHTGGLMPGELAVVGAFAKTGKAQPLSARIVTPTGWMPMGDLAVGDFILGSDGLPQKITGVFDQGLKEIWEVCTGSGVVIEACADHLWMVNDRCVQGDKRVLTTEEISGQVRLPHRQNRPRFTIPMPSPAGYVCQEDLPIDPYLLGLLLGDGGMTGSELRFTSPEPELHQELERRLPPQMRIRQVGQVDRCQSVAIVRDGGSSNFIIDTLRCLGLWGSKSVEKFIPDLYKFASVNDRVLLIQGLMDTDGTCGKKGYIEFFSSSPRLTEDFREVVQSLGGTATLHLREAPKYQGGVGKPAYRVGVRLPCQWSPFLYSSHKINRIRASRREPITNISEVRRTGRFVEMRCISVSNSDRLYRTEGHVLTHNTMFGLHNAAQIVKQGYRPLIFTLEMSLKECEDRLDCMYSGVSYDRLIHGRLSPSEVLQLHKGQEELKEVGGIQIERPEEGDRTVMALISRARQYGADWVFIDQLSHMEPGVKVQTLKEHHGTLVKQLKNEISRSGQEIPCLLAAQLRRGDEVITMESFANASEIEREVDMALGLHRNQNMRDNSLMSLEILGSRRSDNGVWELFWELQHKTEIRILREARTP